MCWVHTYFNADAVAQSGMEGKTMTPTGKDEYPDLDRLIGGYFHEDFDIFGNTLEEVIGEFTNDFASEPEMAARAKRDIERFLAERPDDTGLTKDFQSFFRPGVLPEGWEPGVTNWRQWLTLVAELLLKARRQFQSSKY